MSLTAERVQMAQKKVRKNPYDVENWLVLLKDAQIRKIEDTRGPVFENLVSYFPTSGRFWRIYIEQEIKHCNYDTVERLFKRSLLKVLSLDLWKTYLNYVRDTKSKLPKYKEKMAQAYDFALDNMGMDIASYSIWNDYVKFLKGVEAAGNYAENQKICAIRKIYQRGIVTPMVGIESLWKDYLAFEQGINPVIADKMSSERGRDYMNARRVAKEYEACTRGLIRAAPCLPPTGSSEEARQMELWQKYCAWERSNPLRVEDQALIVKRVMFAYEQCLLCLGHHPSVWLEAAQFLEENARTMAEKGDMEMSRILLEQTEAFYERATSGVLQRCSLLHFAYADFLEQQNKYQKVHKVYQAYLDLKDDDSNDPEEDQDGGQDRPRTTPGAGSRAGTPTTTTTSSSSTSPARKVDATLCYVVYMRFCRRAEGTASARAVFKRARDDLRAGHQVFVAAALMEYYCTKDKKIAGNVFELGYKRFKDVPGYVQQYLDFLWHLNEDNNTRVLFERALSSGAGGGLTPDKSVEVWDRFLEFETAVGDLPGIVKVEKRRSQAFDISKTMTFCPTARIVDRYRFLDLYPCSAEELVSMAYEVHIGSSSADTFSALKGLPVAGAVKVGSGGGGGAVAPLVPDAHLQNGQQSGHHALQREDGRSGRRSRGSAAASNIPGPDVNQMVPFKPKFKWYAGEHRVPGGGFPVPQAAAELCRVLPPPEMFQGPFVIVDRLIDVFLNLNLPEDFVPPSMSSASAGRYFDHAKSSSWSHGPTTGEASSSEGRHHRRHGRDSDRDRSGGKHHHHHHHKSGGDHTTTGGKKRRSSRSDDEDADLTNSSSSAPINDLYRQRQQKRMK